MGHLHMRRQGLQSTKEKPPDAYLENKIKKMWFFVQLFTLAQLKKEIYTYIYADGSPPLQAEKKIHLCNLCVLL